MYKVKCLVFIGRPNSASRGGSGGGGQRRSQGWVDYQYDYEAAGIEKRPASSNKVQK